jgi:hypothetical protein
VSDAHINFITIRERSPDPVVEAEICRRHTGSDDPGKLLTLPPVLLRGWSVDIGDYLVSRCSATPSEDYDGGVCGEHSMRNRALQLAATCRDALNSVMSALQRRASAPQQHPPLRVVMPQHELDRSMRLSLYFDRFPPGFLDLGQTDAVAFLWQPPGPDALDWPLLWGSSRLVPASVKTMYLIDMRRPVRQRLEDLPIRAGPWYGHHYAFVELSGDAELIETEEPRPGAGKRRNAVVVCHDRYGFTAKMATLRLGIGRERRGLPEIQVRILTPVLMS